MTEAELQNKAASIIRQIFPTFQAAEIKCQRSFSIKFGHHNVLIDGEDPGKYAKRGIYDLLLEIDGRPLILFELKKPGLELTQDDINQGVSYARLTDPITPITVISNGSQSLIVDTFSKKELETEYYNNISDRIENSMKVAEADARDSLKLLLDKDQDILFGIINQLTKTECDRLTGDASDWACSLIKDFNVPRSAIGDFTKLVYEEQFVLLYGKAFVGKTTFLFQFFDQSAADHHASLYINAKDQQYSVLKKLANHLSGLLNYQVHPNQVKEWLLLHFDNESRRKITIIYDHFQHTCNPDIKTEIEEFSDIFRMTGNRIILASDVSNLQQITKEKDRNRKTKIGSHFNKFALDEYNVQEYEAAKELLFKNYHLNIVDGGDYSQEYRTPRVWRFFLDGDKPSPGVNGIIPAIQGIGFLELCKKAKDLDHELLINFRKYCNAFIDTVANFDQTSELRLMAVNICCIPASAVTPILETQVIISLIEAGLIERRPLDDDDWLYIPKIPELLAGHTDKFLKEKYLPEFEINFDSAYKDFFETCEILRYGELIAAKIITDIGLAGNIDLYSAIMNKLIHDDPTIEISTGQKTVALYNDPVKVFVKFEEGVETKMIGNGFPYLVLSHLAADCFGDDSPNPHRVRFIALSKIASCNFIMRRADYGFFHNGIPTFDLPGIGEIIQTNIGIIEPVVQALWFNFLNYPDEFDEFFDATVATKQYLVITRIYTAVRNVNMMVDQKRYSLAQKILQTYEKLVPKMLAIAMTNDSASRAERRRIEKRFRKGRK